MNLYQISQECEERLIRLGEMLENGDTPSDDEVNTLLDLQGDLTDKLVNYGKFIVNNEADIDALDAEIKRLTTKKRTLSNRNDALKANMLSAMINNGINEINDPVMPIKIKNNPPAVKIDIDIGKLPAKYIKTKVEADKTALSKALKGGAVIDGVCLVQGQSIKIGV